ncbi:MAG: FAD-dependent oxidoreductase, partial [Thermodesulfobacteriota bacterium]
MPSVAVIGAGFAGCSAAITAAKAGAEVTLLEKTDMLAGLGLLTGVMGGEGGIIASEEAKAMGAGDIWQACESVVTHEIDFIEKLGRKKIKIFSVIGLEGAVRKALES